MKRAPQNQQIWTTESGPLIPDARSQLLSVYPYRLAGPAYATQHPGNLNPYAQAFWNHAGVRLPPMLAGHTFSTMSAPGPQWIPGMAPSSNFGIGAPPIPYYYGMNPTVTSAQDGRELGEIVRTDKRQNTNDDTRIDSDPNKQFYEPISPPKTSHTEYEARARTLQSSLNFDRQSMHNISAFHHPSQPQPTSSFSTDYPYHRSNQNVSGPVFPQGVQTGQYSPICRGSGGVKKSENLRRKALLNSASSALTVTDSTQPPNAALDLATNVNDKGPENTSCVSKPSSDNQTTSLDLVNRQNSATSSTHTKTSHHNPGDQSNPLPQISQEELTNRYYQAMYSNLTQYDHQAILSDTYQAQLLRSMLLNSPNAQFDYSKHVLLQNLPPGDRVSHSDTTMLTQNNSTKASSRASKRTESTVNVGSSTSRQHAQVTLGTENSGPSEAVQFPRDFNYFNRLHQSEHLAAPMRVPELAPPQQNSPRKAKRGGKNSRGGRGKGLQNAGTGTPIEFLHQEAPAEPTICSSTMVSTGACTDVYHPTQSSAHLQQPKQQQQSLEQLQRQALQHQDQDQHPQQQRQHLEQQPQQQQRHHLEQQQQPQRPGQLQQSPQPEQQQQQQQQQKQQQQCKQPNQQPQRHQPEQQQQQHQQLEHEIQQHQKSELQLQQLEQEQQQRLQVREQQQHCLELSLQQHQGLKQYQQLKQLEQQPQQRQQPEQQQDQQQQDQQQQDQHQHSEQEQQQHQQPEKQLQLQHRSPHKAQQSAQIGNHQQHQQEQWQNQQDLPQSEQRRIKPHELELKRRKQLQNQQMQQQQWWTPSRPPYLMKNENRASENSQLFDLGRGSANAGQLVGNLSSESLESAKINLSDTLRDKSHSVTQTSQKPSSSSFQHNIVAKAHRKDFPSQTSTHSQETAEGSEENFFTHERVNSNIPNLQENGNVPKQKRSQNQTLQHSRSIVSSNELFNTGQNIITNSPTTEKNVNDASLSTNISSPQQTAQFLSSSNLNQKDNCSADSRSTLDTISNTRMELVDEVEITGKLIPDSKQTEGWGYSQTSSKTATTHTLSEAGLDEKSNEVHTGTPFNNSKEEYEIGLSVPKHYGWWQHKKDDKHSKGFMHQEHEQYVYPNIGGHNKISNDGASITNFEEHRSEIKKSEQIFDQRAGHGDGCTSAHSSVAEVVKSPGNTSLLSFPSERFNHVFNTRNEKNLAKAQFKEQKSLYNIHDSGTKMTRVQHESDDPGLYANQKLSFGGTIGGEYDPVSSEVLLPKCRRGTEEGDSFINSPVKPELSYQDSSQRQKDVSSSGPLEPRSESSNVSTSSHLQDGSQPFKDNSTSNRNTHPVPEYAQSLLGLNKLTRNWLPSNTQESGPQNVLTGKYTHSFGESGPSKMVPPKSDNGRGKILDSIVNSLHSNQRPSNEQTVNSRLSNSCDTRTAKRTCTDDQDFNRKWQRVPQALSYLDTQVETNPENLSGKQSSKQSDQADSELTTSSILATIPPGFYVDNYQSIRAAGSEFPKGDGSNNTRKMI